MTCTCGTIHANAAKRYDPTQTTTIRKQFERKLANRFRRLKGEINRAVIEQDGFGLRANRGRFEFERSADKVAAFMEWLKEQERSGILEISRGQTTTRANRPEWSDIYIRSAYQRGMAQSAAELRKQGADVADEWVTEAFTRPFHVDRVGLAATRTFEQLRGITDTMSQQIARVLSDGLSQGQGMREIARAMNDRVDKIGLTRARMLARTEVIGAHAEASLNTYEEAGVMGVDAKAEFVTAQDDAVCPECAALEGVVRSIEDARGVIPVHPNCLPGDSLVLARSGITAVSKRWFEGDMVIITTASGRKLTCTPNHPILADTGWQSAKSINLGDNVICDGFRDGPAFGGINDKDVPTPIHEIAEAFGGSGGVSSRPVPVSTPDFHGDGLDGDIAQVWTDGELWRELNAAILHHISQGQLMMADIVGGLRAGFGALDQFVMAGLSAPASVISGDNLSGALISGHAGPLDGFGFRRGAQGNARANKAGINGATADAKLARDIIAGATGPVFADNVINVDVQRFSGHVYNLESGNHSYIAQGILNHNCRCAWVPVVPRASELRLR